MPITSAIAPAPIQTHALTPTPTQVGSGSPSHAPKTASPTSPTSPKHGESTHKGLSRQNSLINELKGKPSAEQASAAQGPSAASAPAAAKALKLPRTSDAIILSVANFESHASKKRKTGEVPRGENKGMKFVDDNFKGHKFEQVTLTGVLSKGEDGKVKFETASNNAETHFMNYFSPASDGIPAKAKMMENYKSPAIKGFTATDVFLSQYAEASQPEGSSKTFPDSLPNELPKTIVRDTVDGMDARIAVFQIFNGGSIADIIDNDGNEKPFPEDKQTINIARGTPEFEMAMATVNAKSTGHIVSDFNTLKGTNHVIESIDISRTGWVSGIKMDIHIGEEQK